MNKGFTLLELLLVIGIIAVMAATGNGYYRNYVKNVEFDTVAKNALFDLKNAQSKAMSGEEDVKWGIHFVNGSDDYYELFLTPTIYSDPARSTRFNVYLPGTITFSNPAEGFNTDIIFDKISGSATSSSVSFVFEGATKTITVTSQGTIYSQ